MIQSTIYLQSTLGLELSTLPPLMRLSGHTLSQEQKCFSLFQQLMSKPVSEMMTSTARVLKPGNRGRSTRPLGPMVFWSVIECKTGLTIEDHQKITVDRYVRLLDLTNVYVMPVLQGIRQNLTPHTLITTANSSHPVNGSGSEVSANAMAILTRSKTSSCPSKLNALTFDSMDSASNSKLSKAPPFASYSTAPIAWRGVLPAEEGGPNTTPE